MSLFEFVPVLTTQHRQQKLVVQLWLKRIPINIEEVGILRCAAVLQDIAPPRRAGAHAHVIRNNVEHNRHSMCVQVLDQCAQIIFSPDLGVQALMIDDVVAMHAAGSCLEKRRRIKM